ncbi:MAG: sulfatase/phosphatase domain-containing protein [Candidatus Krumholzibacteriota bacterium]
MSRSTKWSIRRRAFLGMVGAGALLLAATGCGPSQAPVEKRPNILVIMTDDHTVQAMGCYGSRINRTPNLDRLASEGVRFVQGFCTNAVCSPSRATLLTGKYGHRNGVVTNHDIFDGSQATFPGILSEAGYETALIGKWHLRSEPTGFDYWNILPGQGHYYNPDFIRMGETMREQGYVTDLITDDGLRWLEERDGQAPFCLLLHHKAPHRNWMPGPDQLHLYEDGDIPIPDSYFDDYDTRSEAARSHEMSIAEHMFDAYDLKLTPPAPDERESASQRLDRQMWQGDFDRLTEVQKAAWNAAYDPINERFRKNPPTGRALDEWKYQRYIKDYLRCVASVDENIGRVLDYLDRTGLAENTLVVYTSDQGFFLGEHGWFDKRFMYREAHGIPLLVRLPGEIHARADDEHMVMNLDLAPTILDYAGLSVPEDMQGRSLRGILAGDAPADWRRSVYYHYYEYPANHGVKRHYGVRTDRHLLIHFYHDIDAWELYDLVRDPQEMNNVYDDPAYAGVVAELGAELARLRAQYGDSDESKYMPRPADRREHAALGCAVALRHPYSPKYPAGGPGGLTDGRLGSVDNILADYTAWQGFESVDLEAVVDLGRTVPVERVSAGFLQNSGDWIFLPKSVSFAVSDDGETFRDLETQWNEESPRREGRIRKEFQVERSGAAVTARYLRVRAENIRTCPDWHPGAGGKAWIFADEITVE